jgi:CDP-glucose 4,6-dehydratase
MARWVCPLAIDWTTKRVLITGGTGFVGTHLTKRLLDLKADVGLFVLDEENPISDMVSIIYRGNLQDAPDIARAISRYQPHYIFHLAAQPLVDTALVNVYDTLDTNIRGAINLLQSCVSSAKNLEGIIFISTDKVYGKFDGTVDETAPLIGVGNPYDTSKACADLLAQMYSKVFGLPIVIVRSGNIYGMGDNHWDRLIPGTFMLALSNTNPKIRSNGKFTRDYIFVDDVIDAYLLLADSIKDKFILGKAINIGSQESLSVLDVVHAILACAGTVHLQPEILDTAKFEIPHQHLNWEWAKELGWYPKTSFDDGLRLCLPYYKQMYDKKRKK